MRVENGTEPHGGWHLLALGTELTAPVTPLWAGSRALVAVRGADTLRIFDGACPHRGAHLGHGGRLTDAGGALICPFHGRRIGLGAGTGPMRVTEHEVLDATDAVFVRLVGAGPSHDHGFAVVLKEILATHEITGAVVGRVRTAPEIVIENAFDFDHFSPVHMISRLATPKVAMGDHGELTITTAFRTKTPAWEPGEGFMTTRFFARAYSPGLVVTQLGPNIVFTGATAAPGGGCVARIAVAVPRNTPQSTVAALVEGARHAFEQDLVIWDNLVPGAPDNLDARDAPVRAFRAFCAAFAPLAR